MAQVCADIITTDVPIDVHDDFLEGFLVLNCCSQLYRQCTGEDLPASLGMLARNDVIHWTIEHLCEQTRLDLLAYVDNLAVAFSGRVHPRLPPPIWVDSQLASPAETLAKHLLESGTCPLWTASRQVAILLSREKPRHACLDPNAGG